MRVVLTVAMLAAMAASASVPAVAQSGSMPAPSSQAQGPSEQTQQQLELMVRGDKLIGKEVAGSDGNTIGEIKDVLAGTDGHMQSVIIETGGFLGMGGRRVAVPINKMHIEGERLGADLTREQAADMPEYQEPTNKK
jgi:sporulation protein YlmC with PRC-barrel domain